MHIDISACGEAPRWVYSNENVSGQLSLFYPNNLLNSFLFTHFFSCCDTPLRGCGSGVQSLFHVVLQCNCSENSHNAINQLTVACENVIDCNNVDRKLECNSTEP